MTSQFALQTVLLATKGLAKSSPVESFLQVQTDSRASQAGSLFVPLKGDRFDAHEFVGQAIQNGARGVLVHTWRPEFDALKDQATFVVVKDTLRALQDLAHFWRKQCGFKVIGITGSNGKTSTKEILNPLLGKYFKTHASPGSFNNHWGVPLSLLSAPKDTQIVVQEMGMNHRGEIQRLCEIAEPNVVLVTMIGSAHVGELGSVEGIREAKNEIYKYSPDALRIYNIDNEQTIALYKRALTEEKINPAKIITFSSFNPSANVYLRAERFTLEGLEVSGVIAGREGRAKVSIFGRHNIVNIMAASSAALAVGMAPEKIFEGLQRLDFSSWGRNQWIHPKQGPSILFDGYNANPESMRALLKNLFELDVEGKKVFVFGDMRELGDHSEAAHKEVAELAAQSGLSCIWYMGEHHVAVHKVLESSGFHGQLFFSNDFDPQIAKSVWGQLGLGDIVALKASRGSKIERVLNSWGVDGF